MKNGSLHKKSISFWFLSECHLSRKERHLYFLPCQMHQKRTTKLFLLTTWRRLLFLKNGCLHKKNFFCLFLSECHLCRKERHLYFLPCQMHQKRTTKLFLLTTWRMALFTKRFFFCSFLNIMFLEKKVICTFCLAKCITKGPKKLFLLTTWRMDLPLLTSFFFCLSRKEGHLYFLPCQMHQKRTKKKSFWLHEEWLSPQKELFFLFLSECHLKRKSLVLFALPNASEKDKKNCSF